jgi:hypothetical protein
MLRVVANQKLEKGAATGMVAYFRRSKDSCLRGLLRLPDTKGNTIRVNLVHKKRKAGIKDTGLPEHRLT